MWAVLALFFIAAGLMVLQLAYPVVLGLISLAVRPRMSESARINTDTLPVAVVVPVYANDIDLLPEKLVNTSKLSYSPLHLEIIVSGDGELPELPAMVEQAPRVFPIRFHRTGSWVGKNMAMNEAVRMAGGEIIVVTDVDTRLAQDTVALIADRMKDIRVGGVCGTLKVEKPHHAKPGLGKIQQLYWDYEWWIKNTEMKSLGSVTSCSGQLVAIRKDLYPGLPKDVNDDLYLALAVVAGGHRFLAAPEALAFVPPPSKTLQDELKRRPRIVAGSLTAIWRHRRLLSHLNTFWYGVCLYLHKVVRRLTPVLLAAILVTSGLLALRDGVAWRLFFAAQAVGYTIAWLSLLKHWPGRILGIMAYLLAFNIGTGRGLYEFLAQKGRSKW